MSNKFYYFCLSFFSQGEGAIFGLSDSHFKQLKNSLRHDEFLPVLWFWLWGLSLRKEISWIERGENQMAF